MLRLVWAGLMLALWAGCSCSKDTNPAPAAGEAPKYVVPASGSAQPASPGGAGSSVTALAAHTVPGSEQGSVYNLPLVIKIDVPDVPDEIRGPSPPIVEEPQTPAPAKSPASSGGSFWPWSGGGGKK